MVTKAEIDRRTELYVRADSSASSPVYKVSANEMQPFREKKGQLADKILDHVNTFQKNHKVNRLQAGEMITENCQQSWDSYKKVISGQLQATRPMLYKFCIGMGLGPDDVDVLFALSREGPLNPDGRPDDFIFVRAMEDHDSIFGFIKQYEYYCEKSIAMRERKYIEKEI